MFNNYGKINHAINGKIHHFYDPCSIANCLFTNYQRVYPIHIPFNPNKITISMVQHVSNNQRLTRLTTFRLLRLFRPPRHVGMTKLHFASNGAQAEVSLWWILLTLGKSTISMGKSRRPNAKCSKMFQETTRIIEHLDYSH